MRINATTVVVDRPASRRGYTTTQAARILQISRDEVYDLLSDHRVEWTSHPATGAIVVFIDETPMPAEAPEPLKPRKKRMTMPEYSRTPMTDRERAWLLADWRTHVPPGRMISSRDPEPEPMEVKFPPPLPTLIPDGWMSLREAAGLLRVGIQNVKDWVLDDRLESMSHLGRTLVSRTSVREHLERFE